MIGSENYKWLGQNTEDKICTGSAQGLHRVCTGCTGSAQGLHRVLRRCTGCAQDVRRMCAGCAQAEKMPCAGYLEHALFWYMAGKKSYRGYFWPLKWFPYHYGDLPIDLGLLFKMPHKVYLVRSTLCRTPHPLPGVVVEGQNQKDWSFINTRKLTNYCKNNSQTIVKIIDRSIRTKKYKNPWTGCERRPAAVHHSPHEIGHTICIHLWKEKRAFVKEKKTLETDKKLRKS